MEWHFPVEREAFWKQVICGKYGVEEGRWHSYDVRGSYKVGLWKAIGKEWYTLGGKVRCWKDRWCGDDPFCVTFPSLFAIASSKEVWVEDV